MVTRFERRRFPTGIYLALIPVVGGVAMASLTEVNFEMIGFSCALAACVTSGTDTHQCPLTSRLMLTPSRVYSDSERTLFGPSYRPVSIGFC